MVGADTNVGVDVANVVGLDANAGVHLIVEVDAANVVRLAMDGIVDLIVEVNAEPPVVDVYIHRRGGVVA